MTNKAIIYARVSSKEQETGGFSIPAQLDFLRNYAQQKGFDIIKTFTESVSAKDKNSRIEYDNMIKFARAQKGGCHILVEKTDRLLRNEFNSAEIIELARTTDISVHLAKESLVLDKNSPPTTFFIFTMFSANSSLYPRNLSNEVKKGMNKKAELGFYPGKTPVGYKNIRIGKQPPQIVVDEEKAPFVIKAFELYSTGNYSFSQIAEILSKENFKMRSRLVKKNNIDVILKNPFYTGDFLYKGMYYSGKHTPLISKELFFQCKKIMEQGKTPYKNKYEFLFNNIIQCADCGQYLTADIKKGKYVYYRCFGNKNNDFRCKTKLLPQTKVEEAVIECLNNIHITQEQKSELLAKIKMCFKSDSQNFANLFEKNSKKIIELKNKIDKLYTDKLDGIIPNEFFIEKYNSWSAEVSQLNEQNNSLMQDADDIIQKCELILELLNQAPSLYLRLDYDNKRLLLKTLFSHFSWDGETLTLHTKKVFELLFKHNFSKMVGDIGQISKFKKDINSENIVLFKNIKKLLVA